MVKLQVQWSKEKYEVEYDPSIGFDGFQALLFSLTNVPLERQKVMCKGKMIKESPALDALKDNDKVMLMGTADPPPVAPTTKIVFEEDLTDAQKMKVVKDILSAGLHNLGNTCYMAATLQCLRNVTEVKQALINKYNGAAPLHHDPNAAVVRTLGGLFQSMDRTTQSIAPQMFTQSFRSVFPQFGQQNNEGHWMQQDAEEALIELLNAMAQTLKTDGSASSANASGENNTVDEYFGGRMETRTVPLGTSAQDPSAKVTTEVYRRLRCFIDSETNFLFQGVKNSLTEEVELRGQVLTRTTSLLTLPRYLIVQMMRFDWRKDTQKKSKKLRRVDFPFKLDTSDFTHPTLKHQLTCARNLIKEEQDVKLGLPSINKKVKTEANQTAGSAPSASPSPPPAAAAADAANPWAGSASAMDVDASPSAPGLTLTTPTSGCYELTGVVTHQGRTSDSGHYVGWTKQADGQWIKFDDDVVTRATEDEVKNLAGGGDWHAAYLLFYKRIDDATKFLGHTIPEPAPVKEETKKAGTSSSAPPAAAK